MSKHFITLIFLLSSLQLKAQNYELIVDAVDTLYLAGGVPSALSSTDSSVVPIVSSNPCVLPLMHYAMATQYQNGRVIAVSHEGILTNGTIPLYNNGDFILQSIDWLDLGTGRVTFRSGWASVTNSSSLLTVLQQLGYSLDTLSSTITPSKLINTDVLILGNDWNGNSPYTSAELSAIQNFVAGGGSVLIAGLGWSWPGVITDYPMYQVADLFGIEFTTTPIYDNDKNINGSPLLYNMYPQNVNPASVKACASQAVRDIITRGQDLRVLRLAVSATGNFTQYAGGPAAASQLIDDWLDDINEIYGREYCVRFELIPNNDTLIYNDTLTDPWPAASSGAAGCVGISQITAIQKSVIDSIIGATNYDISHVIESPLLFNGGCGGSFYNGISGGLDLPITRHEIGHQFGQRHTINYSNNDNYELENGGWTIQGGNAHPYAHAQSFYELARHLEKNKPQAGTKISTGNTLPQVDAGVDVAIPISTPFVLSATATDPDADDSLTYVWDNMNRGYPQTIPVADDQQGALFMRLEPSASGVRVIPDMPTVLQGLTQNTQEQLPSAQRVMDLRVTVNDHHKITYNSQIIPASGIGVDDIHIEVASAGPFVVTSQASNGILYPGGQSQEVTWDVNGTDLLPIYTTKVSIDLSLDGGYTYPISLLSGTKNDGSAMVQLPDTNTTQARIRVSADDNIYFNVNAQNFGIEKSQSLSEIDRLLAWVLYPLPFYDVLYLQLDPQHKGAELTLAHIDGRVVQQSFYNGYKMEWDMSHLDPGTYILTVNSQGFKSSRVITKIGKN